jgi:gliding motility-associated-like protein
LAQGENRNWMFGHNAGLNFSTSPPTFFETNMQCWEGGSISFSDTAGNLLFYSNGNKVWNASGAVMLNGEGIQGNGPTAVAPYGFPGSSSQGTLAVQSIINPLQYYLFVLDAMEDGPPYAMGRLRYSIIDMNLDGGMGGVVPGKKNVLLADSMTEKMTIVKAADCGFWLITHKLYNGFYHAFKIDASGISPNAVISSGAVAGELGYGMLHASPDGTRLIMTSAGPLVEVCAFNNANGSVSDAGFFASPGGKIGTCISPDNTKLYLGHYNKLSQYDLTVFPNIADIEASEEIISPTVTFGQMRRGPDGKIYIANVNDNNIAIIESPDMQGPACDYQLFGLSRPTYTQFPATPPATGQYGSGLGQDVVLAGNSAHVILRSVNDTVICGGKPIILAVAPGFRRYVWNTDDTADQVTIHTPGTYWVKSVMNCDIYVDTFHVSLLDHNDWNLGNDTTICPDDVITINAFGPDVTQYTWQDGSQMPIYATAAAGDYYATVNIKGCQLTDTINISLFNPYANILEHDTVVCHDVSVLLHAISFPDAIYLWNDGSTNQQLMAKAPGTYTVYAKNVCGLFIDSVRIRSVNCDCKILVPNAFSPNGDGNNDRYEIRADCSKLITFELYIYNRYGQQVFQSSNINTSWDGQFKGAPADAGTYFFYLKYKASDAEAIERKGSIDLIR